jgi:putative hydrolase of HD superfamily
LILDFFNIAANLKKIPRQGWINKLSLEKPESVADHTYSLAIMGMVFSDLENFNTEKILKIILLHDLAESVVGDMTPDQISKNKKTKLENKAIKKILRKLPPSIQKQYAILWEEYQSNSSEEVKIIHQLDKLEMALQAKIYFNEGHSNEKLSSFLKSAKDEITNPKLLKLFIKISKQHV